MDAIYIVSEIVKAVCIFIICSAWYFWGVKEGKRDAERKFKRETESAAEGSKPGGYSPKADELRTSLPKAPKGGTGKSGRMWQ